MTETLIFMKPDPIPNLMFRNNGDGTFVEQAEKMGISGTGNNNRDAAFGDFDDDGDIDFIVASENAGTYPVFKSEGRVF